MMRRSGFQICGWVVGLSILLMFLVSCESRDKYVGAYQAEATVSARQRVFILELRANGDGLWKVSPHGTKGAPAETPLTWYVKRGELRINTKAGGVVVGKIEKNTIEITLPGSKTLTFSKTQ